METLKKELEMQTFIAGQKSFKIYERQIKAKDWLILRRLSENQDVIKSINRKSKKKVATQKRSESKECFNLQKGLCNKEEYCYNHPTEICQVQRKSNGCKRGFKCKLSHNLKKKVTKFFYKKRFDLLYEKDIHENIITEENIESEKSNNFNEHQTLIKSRTRNTTRLKESAMENHIHNYEPHILPGNSSYANTVKWGRKFYVVGDSHITSTQGDSFDADLNKGKAILSTLIDDQPDVVIFHVVTNDIISSNLSYAEIVNEILKIAKSCEVARVNHQFWSRRIQGRLPLYVKCVTTYLGDFCIKNDIHFIGSYSYTSKYTIFHLKDISSNI